MDNASLAHHFRPAKPLLAQKLCFSPSRRVTFSLRVQRESNQRESTPGIRVWRLRHQTSLAPSPFQGPAYKGHPSPFTPLAASLPPIPFHVDSTRPPDGTLSQPRRPCTHRWFPRSAWEPIQGRSASRRRGASVAACPRGAWARSRLVATRRRAELDGRGRAEIPVRRPSGGVAQGTRDRDVERGTKGQGRPFVTAPGAAPEGGQFRAAKPVCRGGLLFGYFLLARQEKVTRRARRNQ